MDINSAYSFIQFVFNKSQNGNITPLQFNTLAPIAQISIINQVIGNEAEYIPGRPIARNGFLVNQKNLEDLRPLIKLPTTVPIVSGVVQYPSDALYIFTLQVPGAYQPAEPVEFDEAIYLNASQIKPPTALYPKHYVVSSYIYMLPPSLTTCNISYVRRPLTPVWNSTIINQVPVYNPTGSQDFELGELLHLRICQRILEYVGLNLDLAAVTQLSMAMEAQGQ